MGITLRHVQVHWERVILFISDVCLQLTHEGNHKTHVLLVCRLQFRASHGKELLQIILKQEHKNTLPG